MLRLLAGLGCAGCVGAALAGSAPGVVSSRAAQIVVSPSQTSPGKTSTTSIDISVSPKAPAPARLVVYVPQGYGLSTTAAVGTLVGFVELAALTDTDTFFPARAFAKLTAGDRSLGADATAQACSAGTHAAVWIAAPTIGGQSFPLRIYVDPTTGDESSRGAFRLVTCLPSPYTSPGQGGAPAGAQVTEFDLFTELTNPPAAGTYTWRVLVTPYVFGSATVDEGSTFEARARVPLPYVVTVKAAYQAKTQSLVVSGSVLALGKPQAGTKVSLLADWLGTPPDTDTFSLLPDATTRADGTYALRKPRKRIVRADEQAKIGLTAFVDAVHGACTAPPIVPAGCVDESLSPVSTPFETATVTIPKLPAKRR